MTSVEPGGEIHGSHPFTEPLANRDPVRRLRGRLATPVTLWTAPGPAGLTVSSTQVVAGDPGVVYGLVDPESDLYEAITAGGRFTVQVLTPGQRGLADRFAGLEPAPGGLFKQDEWRDTEWGPVLADVPSWAGCQLTASREIGWSHLIEGTVDTVEVGPDEPLLHYRGRYRTLG